MDEKLKKALLHTVTPDCEIIKTWPLAHNGWWSRQAATIEVKL